MPSNTRLTGAHLLNLTVKGNSMGVRIGAFVTRRGFGSEAYRWLSPEEARAFAKNLLEAANKADLQEED